MTGWAWEELGITPTGDAAVIRRAYAARLKQTRPEADRDGFLRLRTAYEAALAQPARAPAREEEEDNEEAGAAQATGLPSPVPPDPLPTAAPAGKEAAPAVGAAVAAALAARDIIAAATALAAARAEGTLPLADDMVLADRLLFLLARDLSLPAEAVRAAATRLGWDEVQASGPGTPMLDRLQARLAAEAWLEGVRRMATSRRLWFGSQKAAAARLLLGWGRIVLSWLLPPEPPLRSLVAQFHAYQPWINSAFDPERVAAAEQMARSRRVRVIAGFWLFALVAPLCMTGVGAHGGAFASLLAGFFGARLLRSFVRPALLGIGALALLAGLTLLLSGSLRQPAVPVASLAPTAALLQRAIAGDAGAAFELGVRAIQGREGARDPAAAAEWFRRAAPVHREASTWLGYLAETGQGMPQDAAESRRYYRDAAQRGDPVAQANLATLLNNHRGGADDPAEAFGWNLRAARQGEPRGLNGVGYAYLTGHGVARDPNQALSWLRAAAEAGQPNAMHSLAGMYLQGTAGAQSPALAYTWAALAARNYPANDEKRPAAEALCAQAAGLLGEDQRAAIDANLHDWKPSPGRAPE